MCIFYLAKIRHSYKNAQTWMQFYEQIMMYVYLYVLDFFIMRYKLRIRKLLPFLLRTLKDDDNPFVFTMSYFDFNLNILFNINLASKSR